MYIRDLINESLSPDMAKLKLTIVTRELTIKLNQAAAAVMDGVKNEDKTVLLPVLNQLAKWVVDSYFPSRAGNGHNIKSLMQDLNADDIGYSMARESELNGKLKILAQLIPAMYEIVDRKEGTALVNAYTNYTNAKEALAAVGKKDKVTKNPSGPTDAEIASNKQADALRGEQSAKVEQVINQVLATLPKDVAVKVRAYVAKSGNKLKALELAMSKFNMSESFNEAISEHNINLDDII